ncbi:SCO family protein [Candidatus Chloroploca asiatica]|uniref:Electron transporter SenC n=1 Tax=Candidatus Chloroploca asiatica TaxID=1506545 RepID=A0A2H3KV83_9CHLR|nr:SCO family protein [Candidatus Chloroploca asiatica]PDV99247.1 electron transporter SenC [Candidatus Chloroploca asiatica]
MKQYSFILLGMVLLMLTACGPSAPQFRGTVLEPAEPAFDFTLIDEQGQPFTLSEQKGQVVVLFFGFTMCPDICPAALADLSVVSRELGADAEAIQVALVSLDPERDTSERLQQYVTAFDPRFKGLRGDEATLAPILKSYGVYSEQRELPNSAMGYTIDHSGFIYAIDKAGNWRILFAHGTAVEDITADLRLLAREGG